MKNPINSYIKYLIENCYEEDYNLYYAEDWKDNYIFTVWEKLKTILIRLLRNICFIVINHNINKKIIHIQV